MVAKETFVGYRPKIAVIVCLKTTANCNLKARSQMNGLSIRNFLTNCHKVFHIHVSITSQQAIRHTETVWVIIYLLLAAVGSLKQLACIFSVSRGQKVHVTCRCAQLCPVMYTRAYVYIYPGALREALILFYV